jgi:hypothetical protein
MEVSRVKRVANGWAANGNCWAVHASTQEDAVRCFHEEAERRTEILSRTFVPKDEKVAA